MQSRILASVVFLSVAPEFALAAPTIGNCAAADAPAPFGGQTCASMCSWTSSTGLKCSLSTAACTGPGDHATAVYDWNNQNAHHFSIFGQCTVGGVADDWCCVVDDTAATPEISKVTLESGSNVDVLGFFYNGVVNDQLQPHRTTSLTGVLVGGSGGDTLIGSPYSSSTYFETIYGDGGDDYITGLDGGDVIYGGSGSDTIYGDDGADRITGGDGADYIEGNDGNDTICETPEDGGGCTSNEVYGDAGNDSIWLDYTAGGCDPAGDFVAGSGGNSGMTDGCGHASAGTWGLLPWAGCDINLTTKPTGCP